jgi:proteasome lid subunit RPN8/RPN11
MIYISKSIFKEFETLSKENCGILYGNNNQIKNIKKFKNVSKKINSFKIKRSEILKFFITNILKYNTFILYHVHVNSPNLSETDKKNMFYNLNYAIIYNNNLFIYKKSKNKIESIKFFR